MTESLRQSPFSFVQPRWRYEVGVEPWGWTHFALSCSTSNTEARCFITQWQLNMTWFKIKFENVIEIVFENFFYLKKY